MPPDRMNNSPETWSKHIAERNASSSLLVNSSPVSPSPLIDALAMRVEWKSLQQLSEKERAFYCSTLDLLASLCSGRNLRTQAIVRQLLPVDHLLHALSLPLSNSSPTLLKVVAGYAKVLQKCYVESSALHPAPKHALDLKLVDEDHTRKWSDVFEDECYGKVFSQSSQAADGLFDVHDEMSNDELLAAVRFLSLPCYRRLRARIGTVEHFQDLLTQRGRDSPTIRNDLFQMLRFVRENRMIEIAAENLQSVQQRALLLSLLSYFVRHQLTPMWVDGVEKELWSLFVSRESGQNRNKNQNQVLHEKREEEVADKVLFIEKILSLIHALLLKRFFDDDYNCNPTVVHSTPHSLSPKNQVSDDDITSREETKATDTVGVRSYFYDLKNLGDEFEFQDILDCCGRRVRVIKRDYSWNTARKESFGVNSREENYGSGFLRALVNKMLLIIKSFRMDDTQSNHGDYLTCAFCMKQLHPHLRLLEQYRHLCERCQKQ